MRKLFLAIIIFVSANWIVAQDSAFTVEVSNDTVLIGNYFIVKYKISNIEGEFKAPDFSNFELIAGPMSNSMYSMINGKTSREIAYTYYLKPMETGISKIEKAKLKVGPEIFYADEADIITLENPENIKTQAKLKDEDNSFFFESDNYNPKPSSEDREAEKRKKLKIRKL